MANAILKAGFVLAAITLGTPAAFAADSAKSGDTSAKGTTKATTGRDSQVASSDKKFMEKAAIGGMAEVEMGQLAQQKGTSDAVKKFGAQMVQDHGKANEELKQLAQSKGVALPTTVDKSHKHDMDKLAKLSGDKFDREYMEHMVKDHKKDVKEFQKASKDAKDPDLKSFAAKTASVIEGHLQLAKRTEDAVKGHPDAGSPEKTGSAAGVTGPASTSTQASTSANVSGNTANLSGNARASGATAPKSSQSANTAH